MSKLRNDERARSSAYIHRDHNRRRARMSALAAVVALSLAAVNPAVRADVTDWYWSGMGATDNWTNPFNWTNVSAPLSSRTTSVYFEPPPIRSRIDLRTDWTVGGVYFQEVAGGSAEFTIFSSNGAGALTLGTRGINNLTPKTQTIDVDVVLGDGQTWTNDGTLVLSGRRSGDLARLYFATNDPGNSLVLLSGDGSLHTDDLYVLAGVTVLFGSADVISSSSLLSVEPGGTVDLFGSHEDIGSLEGGGTVRIGTGHLETGLDGESSTFSGALFGSGQFTKTGAGTLTLTGDNSGFVGTFGINGGTLRIGGTTDTIADTARVNVGTAGTLQIAGNGEEIGSLAGAGTTHLEAGLIVGHNNATTTYAGAITGSGDFTKVGTGSMTLSGNNTFVGTVTIGAGTLKLAAGDNVGDANQVFLASGATLSIEVEDENFGALGGAGGDILLAKALGVGYDNGSSTYLGNISGDGNFTKAGTGIMTLGGQGRFAGSVIVAGGTLNVEGRAETLGRNNPVEVSGGAVLRVAGDGEEIGSIAGKGNVTLAADFRTGRNNASTALSGNVTGSGGFIKSGAGTLNLSGKNAIDGALRVEAGTVAIAGGSTAVSGATIRSRTSLRIDSGSFKTTGRIDVGGSLSLGGGNLDAAAISILPGGVFQLAGGRLAVDTFTGDLSVGAGATVAPGASPGTTYVTGNYVQEAGSVLEIELSAVGHDVLEIGGSAALDGRLHVSLLDGFDPVIGSVFEFLTAAGGISGTFSDVVLPGIAGKLLVLSAPDASRLQLHVAPVPLPASGWLLLAALSVLGRRIGAQAPKCRSVAEDPRR